MLFSITGHRQLLSLASLIVLCASVLALAGMRSKGVSEGPSPQDEPTKAARRVLITGANRGLGLEFARQYAHAGWKVIATARDPDAAMDLKSLGANVRVEALDVADQKSVDAIAARLKDLPIDLLINNAGVSGGGGDAVAQIDPDDYEHVMQVNGIGPMRVTRALLPNLKAGKGKMIVSISSGLGSIENNRNGRHYAYRESKAALNMFMRSLAAELKGDSFICIPMSPGWVKTDMGGPNATLTPEESITGMRKVMDGLKPEDSGKFWSHDGSILPW